MTTRFDRPLYGFRFIETHVGDTLQEIAARELGDASLWVDLISYNNLVPPFIVDDPALVQPGVVLSGSQILIPAPRPVISTTTDPEKVFETDVQLSPTGDLLTDGADFVAVTGRANLRQALKNRVNTDRGELIFHAQTYGCDVRRLIGATNGPTRELLAAQAAKVAVLQDERISAVTDASAAVGGDVISVTVVAETVGGRTIEQTVQL